MARVNPEQLLECLSQGMSNPQAAEICGLQSSTVGKWRRRFVEGGDLDAKYASSNRSRTPFRTSLPDLDADGDAYPDVPDDLDVPDGDGLEDLETVADADDVFHVGTGTSSPTIEGAKDRAASKILEVREARAEFELAQLRQRIAQIENPDPVQEPAPPGVDPLTQMMLAQLSDARAQSQMLMGHMLKLATPQTPPAPTAGLNDTISAIGGILEFVENIRGGESAAPADPISSMLQLAGKAMDRGQALAPLPGHPPGIPSAANGSPSPNGVEPPPRPATQEGGALSPDQEIRRRSTEWFGLVEREMAMGSDPSAVAEGLSESIGLLPLELREAITGNFSMEMLVPVMAKFLDADQVKRIVTAVRSQTQHAEFMGVLLHDLREIHAQERNTAIQLTEAGQAHPDPKRYDEVNTNGQPDE